MVLDMLRQRRHAPDPPIKLTGPRGHRQAETVPTKPGGGAHPHRGVMREDRPKPPGPLKLQSESRSRSRAGSSVHTQHRRGLCKGMEIQKSVDKEWKTNAGEAGGFRQPPGKRAKAAERGRAGPRRPRSRCRHQRSRRGQGPALTAAPPAHTLFLLLRVRRSGPPSPRFQALYTCPSTLPELHWTLRSDTRLPQETGRCSRAGTASAPVAPHLERACLQ